MEDENLALYLPGEGGSSLPSCRNAGSNLLQTVDPKRVDAGRNDSCTYLRALGSGR
ncbi:unnamed protein product, partial [Gulo gulo]